MTVSPTEGKAKPAKNGLSKRAKEMSLRMGCRFMLYSFRQCVPNVWANIINIVWICKGGIDGFEAGGWGEELRVRVWAGGESGCEAGVERERLRRGFGGAGRRLRREYVFLTLICVLGLG